jgi:transcriptional regulator with XRE-family HTH domain
MDHRVLARELIRGLRGGRSQQSTNRRFGYSSNVLHGWETGVRVPRVSDFLRLAELAHVDVVNVLNEFSPHGALPIQCKSHDRRNVRLWIEALCHGRPHSVLARALGCNRNTIARWIAGDTEPRLTQALGLVECTTLRLLDFVGRFVDPARLPSVQRAYRDLLLQRQVAYELPWTHGVLRAIELHVDSDPKGHRPGFFAKRLGIALAEEEQAVSALGRARQIRRVRGKWVARRVLAVDTRLDPEGNLRLKRHWAEVAAQRLARTTPPETGLFSYNLFAISEEGLELIRAAHLSYYERIRAIVAECRRPTRVVLANLQLIPLDE